jgi:hypothetical protein
LDLVCFLVCRSTVFCAEDLPSPLNPLSPPSSGLNNLGTSRAGRCWGGEKRPTHCVADRHKTRSCIAVSPDWRAAPRGPPTILPGMSRALRHTAYIAVPRRLCVVISIS